MLEQVGESETEWAALRVAAIADLAPIGPIETTLADRIALLMWRLRRVANAEQAQHALRLDDIGWKATDEGQAEFNHLPLCDGPRDVPDRAELVEYLDEANERAERVTGLDPNDSLDPTDVLELLGEIDNLADSMDVDTEERDQPDPNRPDGWTVAQLETAIVEWVGVLTDSSGLPYRWLDAVAKYISRQSLRQTGMDYRFRLRAMRLTAERHILDAKRFDRIAQQDTHLSRALYRTLAELNRLQHRRAVAAARRGRAGFAGQQLGLFS